MKNSLPRSLHFMMKKLSETILLSALILVCLSCSEEVALQTLPENQDETLEQPADDDFSDSKIYIGLNVNGPDAVKSKAGPTFEDCENTIYNGRIFIFEESSDKNEANAFCVSSGVLRNPEETPGPGIVVKTARYRNIELDEFEYDETKTYYALAVLNYNFKFIFPRKDDTFGGWATTPQDSEMFLYVKDILSDVTDNKYKYITMTNATGQPNHKSGETFDPFTLTKIEPGDLKRGRFDDDHEVKTSIFVQRNLAKVTFSTVNSDIDINNKLVKIGDSQVQLNLTNMMLDVVNTESYPVQNISGLTWENAWSHSPSANWDVYDQVYWAKDPNYDDGNKSKSNGNFVTSLANPPLLIGSNEPLYCLENTFDIERMIQGQTTRAIIRCALEWWGTTDKDNGPNSQIKLPDGYLGEGQTSYQEISGHYNDFDTYGFFIIGKYDDAKLWDFMHIKQVLENKAKEVTGSNIEVSLKEEIYKDWTKGGEYALNNLINVSESSLSDEIWNLMANAIGLNDAFTDKISYYVSKYVFYPIRIRHFSDEEGVGWDGSFIEKEGVKYAKYESRHLGRYGVLRNNHYEILIKSIKSVGSPYQFPDFPEEMTDDVPDDYYIDVEVKVKPWNKRDNSFDLM